MRRRNMGDGTRVRREAVAHYKAMAKNYDAMGAHYCADECRETAARLAQLPRGSRLLAGESVFEEDA